MDTITYWQHAAGDANRNYAAVCLKWDVILNGPGYAGPLPDCKDELLKDGWTSRKITGLLRFSKTMKEDDLVGLRLGTTDVLGVGVIVGKYEWLEVFSDIDGWDLHHVRRVKWFWKGHKSFGEYTLKLGDTTQVLDSTEVIQWIGSIPRNKTERNLIILPKAITAQ